MHAKNASQNLAQDKFHHDFNGGKAVSVPNFCPPSSNLRHGIESIERAMMKLDHRINRGDIYRKVPDGKNIYIIF